MSKPSHHLLIVLSLTTLLIAVVDRATTEAPTKPNYFDYLCRSNFGNYTTNSTYETNIESVLSDLQDHGSLEPFYNSTAGSGRNAVYGQYYCRGDVDSKLCGDCIQQAAQTLFRNCTLFKSGIVWYEECTLRYSNESMAGVESEFPRSWEWSTNNVSDSVTLASVLKDTVDKLINESTQGKKPSLFATGQGVLSAFEPVYCLVQCSPDLNATECETCLRAAYAFIPTCCGTMSKQVALFYATCQLRYTIGDAFYAVPNAPPPPPGSAPPSSGLAGSGTDSRSPPSTNTTSTTTTKGASVALRSSGGGLVMTALTLLMLVVVKT